MDEDSTATPSAAGSAVPPADLAPETAGRIGVDDIGTDLVAAVDGLRDLDAEPVHQHAARFAAVHTQLQDALADTDRGDPNSR